MKARPYYVNPFKQVVIRVIRGADVPLDIIWRAFHSLPESDRDAMPYVPRLLALES